MERWPSAPFCVRVSRDEEAAIKNQTLLLVSGEEDAVVPSTDFAFPGLLLIHPLSPFAARISAEDLGKRGFFHGPFEIGAPHEMARSRTRG